MELPVSVELYNSESEEENARPQILLSDYVVYVAAGSEFNYADYINNINDGGTISVDEGAMSSVMFQSDLNMNEPGMYKATYSYVSTRTGLTGSATMYIIVE